MTLSPPDILKIMKATFVARAEHYESIDSTNDRAAERAADTGAELPVLIIADQQTAGRGRGANRWWTGPGSLAMSLAIEPAMIAAQGDEPSPLISLAVGVAVAEMLEPFAPDQAVGIHWPNDVMLAGGKVAGILVEVLPNRRHIIGIGINTNSSLADAPEELKPTAATLRDATGCEYDHTQFVIELLGRLQDAFEQLIADPQEIIRRANELCLQRGKTLTLDQGNRQVTGRCEGIAPDGALLLNTPDGRTAHYSGTILPC